MSKIVDITSKLNFDKNPIIIVNGQQFEVNADAETVLRMLGVLKDKNELDGTMEAYKMLFSEEDREKISEMKLSFKDFMTLIKEVVNVVIDGEDNMGETQAPTMI